MDSSRTQSPPTSALRTSQKTTKTPLGPRAASLGSLTHPGSFISTRVTPTTYIPVQPIFARSANQSECSVTPCAVNFPATSPNERRTLPHQKIICLATVNDSPEDDEDTPTTDGQSPLIIELPADTSVHNVQVDCPVDPLEFHITCDESLYTTHKNATYKFNNIHHSSANPQAEQLRQAILQRIQHWTLPKKASEYQLCAQLENTPKGSYQICVFFAERDTAASTDQTN